MNAAGGRAEPLTYAALDAYLGLRYSGHLGTALVERWRSPKRITVTSKTGDRLTFRPGDGCEHAFSDLGTVELCVRCGLWEASEARNALLASAAATGDPF